MTAESEAAKAVVLRYVEEIQNQHDLDAIDDIFAEDFKHLGGTADESTADRAAIRPFYVDFFRSFPDLQCTVEAQLAEGDRVASFKTLRATHRGDFHGIPATGKRVEFHISDLFRVVDGKLAESWALLDEAGLLRQLGMQIPGWD